MKSIIHKLLPKVLGRNLNSTPKEVIVSQMNEPRPLPMGRAEFEEWSDRIISGALVPCSPDGQEVLVESQKFALADMIMHLGPTESHKADAYFIHSLRKYAINQVADSMRREIRDAAKARLQAIEEAKERKDEEEASLDSAVKSLEKSDEVTTTS